MYAMDLKIIFSYSIFIEKQTWYVYTKYYKFIIFKNIHNWFQDTNLNLLTYQKKKNIKKRNSVDLIRTINKKIPGFVRAIFT